MGAKADWDLWSGQKRWWNWYLTSVVNFGEVWMAQVAKSTLLTSMLVRLGSVQMLKREWGAESKGKLPHLFIPSKTAAFGSWVCSGRPTFGQNCSLGAWICSERPALGQTTLRIMIHSIYALYNDKLIKCNKTKKYKEGNKIKKQD